MLGSPGGMDDCSPRVGPGPEQELATAAGERCCLALVSFHSVALPEALMDRTGSRSDAIPCDPGRIRVIPGAHSRDNRRRPTRMDAAVADVPPCHARVLPGGAKRLRAGRFGMEASRSGRWARDRLHEARRPRAIAASTLIAAFGCSAPNRLRADVSRRSRRRACRRWIAGTST